MDIRERSHITCAKRERRAFQTAYASVNFFYPMPKIAYGGESEDQELPKMGLHNM